MLGCSPGSNMARLEIFSLVYSFSSLPISDQTVTPRRFQVTLPAITKDLAYVFWKNWTYLFSWPYLCRWLEANKTTIVGCQHTVNILICTKCTNLVVMQKWKQKHLEWICASQSSRSCDFWLDKGKTWMCCYDWPVKWCYSLSRLKLNATIDCPGKSSRWVLRSPSFLISHMLLMQQQEGRYQHVHR